MKKIAVHINEDNLFDKRWIDYINAYKDYQAVPVNMKSCDILDKIRDCEGVMWHYLHSPLDKQAAPKILTAIEMCMKKKVWPNLNTRWFFDEKVSQHYFLSSIGVNHIPSRVFWSYDEAKDFLYQTKEYPLVFKLSVGAGSANVIKINTMEEGLYWLNRIFHEGIYPYSFNEHKENYPKVFSRTKQAVQFMLKIKRPQVPVHYQIQKEYFYIQKFIPDNPYDIRITVIGDRAFVYTRGNREDDFRASGSGKIDYNPDIIPTEAVKLAFTVSKQFGFQSMAYDFLVDETGAPLINEMSYGYVDTYIYNCPGHWNQNMEWQEGNMWPEEAHIEDFINEIERQNGSVS